MSDRISIHDAKSGEEVNFNIPSSSSSSVALFTLLALRLLFALQVLAILSFNLASLRLGLLPLVLLALL